MLIDKVEDDFLERGISTIKERIDRLLKVRLVIEER